MTLQFVGVTFVLYLVLTFAPLNVPWPARLVQLVGLPTAAYFASGWASQRFLVDPVKRKRVERTLAGFVGGLLIAGAISALQQRHHFECTQYAGHGDNRECVGDYRLVRGPDYQGAVLLVMLGYVALTLGMHSRENEIPGSK